jgi:hypothetical protein
MQDEMSSGEKELEATLKQLRPTATGVDPLAVAFAAGRREGRRSLLGWRIAATVLAIGFAGMSMQAFRSAPPVSQMARNLSPIVVAENDLSYAKIRAAVLENGVAALPTTHCSGSSDRVYRAGDQAGSIE